MKTLVIILAVAIGGVFTALAFDGASFLDQITGSGKLVTEKRVATDFHGVEAGGAIELTVTAQQDYSVEVEADDNIIGHVITEVRGGILHIETDVNSINNATIHVTISLPQLDYLDISGAARAMASKIKADKLTLEVSGASKLTAEGTSKQLHGDISGASTLSAENLTAERVEIETSGASRSHVNATESLTADASGASTIYYSGEPKNREVGTSGASSIKRR